MDAAHEQEVADALVQKRIGLEHQLEQVEHTYSEIEELARASMESYQAAAAELIAEQESAELGRIASLEAQIAATQRQSAEQNVSCASRSGGCLVRSRSESLIIGGLAWCWIVGFWDGFHSASTT